MPRMRVPLFPLLAGLVLLACLPALAEPAEMPAPTECLVLPVGPRPRAFPFSTDPVLAALMDGTWVAPTKAGDAFVMPDGRSVPWEACAAGEGGGFEHRGLMGGWAYVALESPDEHVVLLQGEGSGSVFVNGEPHAGDVYGTGWLRVPVLLHAGRNEILLSGRMGHVRVRLFTPEALVSLDPRDLTLPDLVVGQPAETLGAIVLESASTETETGLKLLARVGDGAETETALPSMPPLTQRKMGFAIRGAAPGEAGTAPLTLRLTDASGTELAQVRLDLRVRRPHETRKVTFLSAIDGSVQYYGLYPASVDQEPGRGALVLTCHGAGVEGIGQADAYSPKSWADLAAPTNRRPYGFDWEDWGRLDAIEVLDHATASRKPDPSRVYLTGHSMGGHGTWHLGVTYPDRFAAIGPSAGWISLLEMGRVGEPAPEGTIEEILRRPTSPSDTRALQRNLLAQGVYVLHGDADDNVPVDEARSMREALTGFHRDWEYHEQAGAGHWWDDDSGEPGSACVDWAPMFQFFARHRIPALDEVRDIEFTTMSPTVSSRCSWATIEMQRKQFAQSTIKLHWDPLGLKLSGTTDNVRRLAIAVPNLPSAATVKVSLDGSELSIETDPNYGGAFWLARSDAGWEMTAPAASTSKTPERGGPFRAAFANRMVLVYGTHGSEAENRWALARARYDAETFYYRGNGSMDMVADTVFDPEAYLDRNVILYGNRDTNSAFAQVLRDDEPIVLSEGTLRVGERELSGEDLACLFVRPRVDSHTALVGVVGGTGLAGMRATDRAAWFQSAAAYPDFVIFTSAIARQGLAAVRGAGFFDESWGLEQAEVVWRE
jgi:dienelactone hydrolase